MNQTLSSSHLTIPNTPFLTVLKIYNKLKVNLCIGQFLLSFSSWFNSDLFKALVYKGL